jgi:hypothetical protein
MLVAVAGVQRVHGDVVLEQRGVDAVRAADVQHLRHRHLPRVAVLLDELREVRLGLLRYAVVELAQLPEVGTGIGPVVDVVERDFSGGVEAHGLLLSGVAG